jgi:hypothetical protein
MPKTTHELPCTINVACLFDVQNPQIKKLLWNGRVYDICQLGLHYTFKRGLTLFHVFCVSSKNLSFKLTFDTFNLKWSLEEVYDESLG